MAPPNLDMRFCNLCTAQTDYLLWGGDGYFADLTGGGSPSQNACVNWNLQDCALNGGFINIGPPWAFIDQQTDTRYVPDVTSSINWTDVSLKSVDVNLNPSLEPPVGYHLDLAFSGYNNLFRGSRLRIMPAAGNTWVLRDNIFDKVTFYQDTAYTLDNDHNAYWPCSADELLQVYDYLTPSAVLMGGAGDQTLPIAPEYQSGPFGDFYFSPASTTFAYLSNHGSQSAPTAALYHYTDRTDQQKEAGQNPVNIGIHYVAAGIGTGLPVDSDSDGIPD